MEGGNILVIKLGAFGDFIQALGPMAAIRRHHPHDRITLLTTAPFASLGRECGYFNRIWIDSKPRWSQPGQWLDLARKLRSGKFSRVYDLQNNDRTGLYFRLFGSRKPEWVGAVRGASHCNSSPDRTAGHAFAGHAQTLGLVGIRDIMVDDLSWIHADTSRLALPRPYILLAPGSAPNRPEKRWPAESFGSLAQNLSAWGYTPVIVGTASEKPLAGTIHAACPDAVDLCGETSLTDLAVLARSAAGAVGNDTGPMHMIAPTGCPAIVLFSKASDPARHAPLGPRVRILHQSDDILSQITPDDFRSEGTTTGMR